jgi:Lar family restriction alleviation protein
MTDSGNHYEMKYRPPSLKPCPFCGSETEMERWEDHNGDYDGSARVSCVARDCPGAHTWQVSEDEAIKLWNEREEKPPEARG